MLGDTKPKLDQGTAREIARRINAREVVGVNGVVEELAFAAPLHDAWIVLLFDHSDKTREPRGPIETFTTDDEYTAFAGARHRQALAEVAWMTPVHTGTED